MIRAFLTSSLFLFSFHIAQAQFMELYAIPGKFDFIEYDNLLNVYGVRNTEIFKYKSDGTFAFRFSDEQMGEVSALDITYSLRPMVMYPDLNYVILLDNTLSDNRGRINLLSKNISMGILGCSSVQNYFWFYDAMSFSLIRMNENFKQVGTTGNLAQVLRLDLNPNYLVEFANRIYLNNPESGILVFDIFGTYINTIPIKGLERFQVLENTVVYFEDNKLHRYNMRDYTETEIELPEDCSQALVFKNRVAGLCGDNIKVWELIMP
ncbi:MAG: hypothetical protein ACI9RU_003145 [Litorivivens sp.]|jgi:hypothetical protein